MNLAKKIFLRTKQVILCVMIILCTFHLVSCTSFDGELSDKQRSVNRVRERTARKIQTESGLIPFGTGAQMMNQIQMLALSFQHIGPVSREEGRELIIAAVEIFAEEINKDEKIRPYLYKHPFSPKRLEVCIYLINPDGSGISSEDFKIINCSEGMLQLLGKSEEPPFLKIVYKETYEEALGKCSASRIALHRSS